MALDNKWVTYLDRSYKSIKTSILNRVKTIVPEMTDLSESNLFVILVSIFSGLIEQINYYVDNIARESYITTARRYSSIVKLTRLIDYRIRAKISAKVDIRITVMGEDGLPVNLNNNYIIPIGTIFSDSSGVEFITTKAVTLFANSSFCIVGARQSKTITNNAIGTTNTYENQKFRLSDNYEHNTLQITINSETWELRDTLAFSGSTDKHFIVDINEYKEAYVVFGDGVNGAMPLAGQVIYATYYETQGINGNIDANTITTLVSELELPIQVPAVSYFSVVNSVASSGGVNEEDLERIRRHAPLSLRTLERAVTRKDYKDIAELIPGIGKAAVKIDNITKRIIIYVAPEGGGTANNTLLQTVVDEFEVKGMIGPQVIAMASGETFLRINMTVTAKFRRDPQETLSDIYAALIDKFGFNNSDVNRSIRVSDIISLIDNLDKVDFLTLNSLTTKPYPRIVDGVNPLENNWRVLVTDKSTYNSKWRIITVSTTLANIYKTDQYGYETKDGELTIHATDPGSTTYTSQDESLELAIWGSFTMGDSWEFYTYPYNGDLVFQDYTIPNIKVSELSITVNEQLIP